MAGGNSGTKKQKAMENLRGSDKGLLTHVKRMTIEKSMDMFEDIDFIR